MGGSVELFRERVCGIDIGKASVVACVRIDKGVGVKAEMTTRTFSTTTAGLLLLLGWLRQQRVQLVGMESTGVYWKRPFYLLEGDFEVWLLNPQHVKIVPGRKSDVKDSQWLAELTAYGLVPASFVPPRPIRGLRETTRYRSALVRERTREVQRLHKVLEEAGIKLSLVASDINGASGTAMLQALIDGQNDPGRLADLAKGSLRQKIPQLVEALTGDFTRLHGLMAKRMMQRIRELDTAIADIEIQIQVQLLPYAEQARRLMTIPGVGEHVAPVIIAEMGIDMTQFPSAAHVASWAGLCPGMNQSAGRNKSSATRKGSPHLRGALGDAAWAASRTKDTYLADSHRRIAKRRGARKATVATSRKIAEAAYYVLAHHVDYRDLGPEYLARRKNPQRRVKQLLHELNRLGCQVQVTQPAA
jgi:transposase